MQKQNDALVIIPAYNEADSIGLVIDKIREYAGEADIVVINDGSEDDTSVIAEAKGVNVLNLPYNIGIGGAVQTGYKFALEMGYGIAIQVDGDGQHPADSINKLIDGIKNNEADMIIGSRYIQGDVRESSMIRATGKWILAKIISLLTGQQVTDSSSGFRAANRKTIKLLARMYPRDYPEPESIVFLVRENFQVKEIPVKMTERSTGQSSITLLKGVYYVIKIVLATIIDMFKKRIAEKER
jgi:glycosyltransferase involved in cell wall biosynthesis